MASCQGYKVGENNIEPIRQKGKDMTKKIQERLIQEIQMASDDVWEERRGEEAEEYGGDEFLIVAGNELCYNGSPADICWLIGMAMFDIARQGNIPLGAITKTSEAWARRLAGLPAETD